MAVVDFVADPGALKALPAFDRVLYHLGNNPWFHRDILRAFLLWPDAVVLHDTVFYYLTAGGGRGALLEDLLRTDPRNAFSELDAILEASPEGDLLRYRPPRGTRASCACWIAPGRCWCTTGPPAKRCTNRGSPAQPT